jgi:hypothetical protein
MPTPQGFITRIEAQELYQRSKQSFIRDVDQARTREDSTFLKNFVVILKDDSIIPGEEATKKVLRANDSLKPEWYIKQSFLETRYWIKGKKRRAKKKSEKEGDSNSGTIKPTNVSNLEDPYVKLLEKTNDDLRNQNARQLELIGELTENQKQSNVLVKSFADILNGGGNLPDELSSSLQKLNSNSSPVESRDTDAIEVKADITETTTTKPAEDSEEPSSNESIWQKDLFWFINNRFQK